MTAVNIEQELKQGKLNSLYLLYGEEEFLIDNCIKKIKKLFGNMLLGINYIQIDEKNVDSLISEIATPAFGYSKKLIIAKKTNCFKKAKKGATNKNNSFETKISKYIEENINIINDSIVLVFVEDEVDKNSIYNVIEKNGIICNFEKLKPQEIMARIKSICNAYKVKIDNQTMQIFIETCSSNMQVLINEIRKLIEYAGENGTITKEAINLLSIKELEAVIFDLTDSLGKKDTKNAINTLKELLYNKEPIQKILITLYNHFKKLYITSIALENNLNLIESLNLKSNQIFLANKYKAQSKFFNKDVLRKILQELIDLDYNYKQGNIDINVGLEAILCTYC